MVQQQYTRLGQFGDDDQGTGQDDATGLENIVDLKQINARLQDWFQKIKSKTPTDAKDFDRFSAEIHSSVFTPTFHVDNPIETTEGSKGLSVEQYKAAVESVREAISAGIQPRLVTKGSSGSYFALNKQHKIVGIFKPKNEEPYGQLNPKWTKWLHRNLFPCFFGRSCLIPNLSYISEAAACLLDRQLRTNIVPPTDVIWLSSTSFNYDYFDRRAFTTKGKSLPAKQGSFQVFLEGFKDATEFLREHPWPDVAPTRSHESQRRTWTHCVGTSELGSDALDELQSEITTSDRQMSQFWTEDLMQKMREELEKLVILDYIMRNTDRGLDNWMLKVSSTGNPTTDKVELVLSSAHLQTDIIARPPSSTSMSHSQASREHDTSQNVSLGAIDNSLAFPWKHPDEWRSFPFGWLFLPASLIGQPFSTRTKQHFLPLLTDPTWWRSTTSSLKALFAQDADFQERMFAKQMAVLKGQAWNVMETLRSGDQGPLELARRPRLHVWTDIMEVPVTATTKKLKTTSTRMAKKHAARSDTEEIDLGTVVESSGQLPSSLPQTRFPGYEAIRSSSDFADIGLARKKQYDSQPSGTSHVGFQESSQSESSPQGKQRNRGMSLGVRPSRFGGDEESDLGDLGYALMHEEEASTRQVVVERLETVHGAEAVFSWC